MRQERTIIALIALGQLLVGGCNGGGGSSGGGSMSAGAVWPDRGGGTTSRVPAVVGTGRVVFESDTGESCCVALGPGFIWGDQAAVEKISNQGFVSSAELPDVPTDDPTTEAPFDSTDAEFVPGPSPGLGDLPLGPATVTLSAFAGDFAPAVLGIVATCGTIPPTAARPCDPVRVAAPAFESAPVRVSIVGGQRTDLGEVPMRALPFVLEMSPLQGTTNPQPLDIAFTVVDAVTGIRRDSVGLELTFEPDAASSADSITEPVSIELRSCSDLTSPPCSPGGTLGLVGFKATGRVPRLPAGPVDVRITAEDLGDPATALDFRYPIFVSPSVAPQSTGRGASGR